MAVTESDVRNSITAELPDNLVKAIRPLNVRNVFNKIADWLRDTVGNPGTQNLVDGTTITFDVSAGNSAKVTLGGNRSLNLINHKAGQYYTLIVQQDGMGGRTLAAPAGSKVGFGGAGVLGLTPTANAIDVLSVYSDGTFLYWLISENFT